MYYINFQIINQNLLSSNQIGGFFYFFYQEKTKSSKDKDFYHFCQGVTLANVLKGSGGPVIVFSCYFTDIEKVLYIHACIQSGSWYQ